MEKSLQAKQAWIATLAKPIVPVARNRLIAATTAVKLARTLMPSGLANVFAPFEGGRWGGQVPAGGPGWLKPFDKPAEETGGLFAIRQLAIELDRWGSAVASTHGVDEALDKLVYDEEYAMTLPVTDPYRLDHADEVAYEALRHRGGNCGYYASATFALLRHGGVAPLDMLIILPRAGGRFADSHTVAVLGIPDVEGNQKEPPFAQWSEQAVIADPTTDEMGMPASVLGARWPPEKYRLLSYVRVPPGKPGG
jgi:hypothetical protein